MKWRIVASEGEEGTAGQIIEFEGEFSEGFVGFTYHTTFDLSESQLKGVKSLPNYLRQVADRIEGEVETRIADARAKQQDLPAPDSPIKQLVCEICSETIAIFDVKDLSMPVMGNMFKSKDPEHGLPDPFPADITWEHMYCPYCNNRPFIVPEGKEEVGPERLLTTGGWVEIFKGIPAGTEVKIELADAAGEMDKIDGMDGGENLEEPSPFTPTETPHLYALITRIREVKPTHVVIHDREEFDRLWDEMCEALASRGGLYGGKPLVADHDWFKQYENFLCEGIPIVFSEEQITQQDDPARDIGKDEPQEAPEITTTDAPHETTPPTEPVNKIDNTYKESGERPSAFEPETHPCPTCGKPFPKQQSLAAHMRHCKEKNDGVDEGKAD